MNKHFLRLGLIISVVLFTGAGCFNVGGTTNVTTSGPVGVFGSTDRGQTWKQISLLPQAEGVKNLTQVEAYRIFEDPQDPEAMYWATRANGLLFTYDGGRSWAQAKSPMDKGFVYGVAVSPKNKCLIFTTDGYKVYKSEDCSRSWLEVYREDNAGSRISNLIFEPWGANRLVLTKINGDILSSKDTGSTWTIINRLGQRIENLVADPQTKNLLYLATREQGPYRSEDGGATWISLLEKVKSFPGAKTYRRMFVNPSKTGVLYWISTYGILTSTDRGDSWTPLKLISSPGSVDIYAFAVNPKNDQEIYYTSTIAGRSTLFHSVDGGENWKTSRLPTGQIPVVLRIHPIQDNILYAAFAVPIKQ